MRGGGGDATSCQQPRLRSGSRPRDRTSLAHGAAGGTPSDLPPPEATGSRRAGEDTENVLLQDPGRRQRRPGGAGRGILPAAGFLGSVWVDSKHQQLGSQRTHWALGRAGFWPRGEGLLLSCGPRLLGAQPSDQAAPAGLGFGQACPGARSPPQGLSRVSPGPRDASFRGRPHRPQQPALRPGHTDVAGALCPRSLNASRVWAPRPRCPALLLCQQETAAGRGLAPGPHAPGPCVPGCQALVLPSVPTASAHGCAYVWTTARRHVPDMPPGALL